MAGYVASQLYTFSTLFSNLKELLAPLKVHRTQTGHDHNYSASKFESYF